MDFYTSISRFYDQIFPYDDSQLDFVISFLSGKKNQAVLETGCGTGHLSVKLAEKGFNIRSIDYDGEMIRQALKNKKKQFNLSGFQRDGHALYRQGICR